MSSVVIKLQQVATVHSSTLLTHPQEYHARWKLLIDAELEEDIAQIQMRIHKWRKAKLQAEGMASCNSHLFSFLFSYVY